MRLLYCHCVLLLSLASIAGAGTIPVATPDHEGPVDFQNDLLPVLRTSCLACHNKTKAKAHLVLETPADILRGGSSGPAAIAGRGDASLIVQAAAHRSDDLVMPPADNKVAAPDLTPQQLGLIRLWIDQGARGTVHDLAEIRWQPLSSTVAPVYGVAVSYDGRFVAAGRANQVFIYQLPLRRLVSTLTDAQLQQNPVYRGQNVAHRDLVNAVAFSPDGSLLATAGFREVKLWRRPRNVRQFTIEQSSNAEGLVLVASLDGRRFAAGDSEGHIRVYDADGKPLSQWSAPAGVIAMCFDRSGDRLATAGGDGMLAVWTADDGKLLVQVKSETSVRAMAWTADGKRLTCGGEDKTIHVWGFNADSPAELVLEGDLAGHAETIIALATVPAAPSEVFSGSKDGTVRLWDVTRQKEIRRLVHGAPVTAVAVRADGKRFAAAGLNNLARLWDADGKPIAEIKGDRYAYDRVAARIADLSYADTILSIRKNELQTADAQHAKQIDQTKKTTEALIAAEKAVDDRQREQTAAVAAQAAADKALADVNAQIKSNSDRRAAAESALAHAITAAKDAAKSVAATQPSSQVPKLIDAVAAAARNAGNIDSLLSGADTKTGQQKKDATDRLTATTKALATAEAATASAITARKSANDELQNAIKLAQQAADAQAAARVALEAAQTRRGAIDRELNAAKQAATESEKPVRFLAFSPDGSLLATSSDDQLVHTYSSESGLPFETFGPGRQPVRGIAFSGSHALAWATQQEIAACNLEPSWTLERTLGTGDGSSPLADRVTALSFSPDGLRLATGGGVPSRGGEIRIWEVATGNLLRSFDEVHSDTVLSLAYCPGGDLLASGSADRFMKVIDASSGSILRSFEGHNHHILGVSWKRDAHTLATAGADNVVKIWDLATGQKKASLEGFGKEVTGVRYLGDSSEVLAACGDGAVRILRDDGNSERILFSGSDFIDCCDITPDGHTIVAGADDGSVRAWDSPNGRPVLLPSPSSAR